MIKGMETPALIRLRALASAVRLQRPIEIVDVGANPINAPDYANLLNCGLARVTGFEPHEEAFATLEAEASDVARFFPYAVGDGKTHELRVCKGSGLTSLLEPNQKAFAYLGRLQRHARVVERKPVETMRLDDIPDLGQIDFLKIDIQGGELSVFQNARATLSNCLAVMTEVAFTQLYVGQPLIDAQMVELRGQGFDFHKFMFLKTMALPSSLNVQMRPRAARSQAVDGDAVFIRNLMDLSSAAPEDLKRLAVLAEGCFGSHDLALRCLSYLVEQDHLTRNDIDDYIALLETI